VYLLCDLLCGLLIIVCLLPSALLLQSPDRGLFDAFT
jgi:hypothetical protein